MILREHPEGWLAITQPEHAKLAARLAAAMPLPPVDALGERNALLAAIACHDDGWEAWDREFTVDPELGRPRAFNEMARVDSLPIWRASIERAQAVSSLAGWCVASHFIRLAGLGEVDAATIEWQRWAQARAQDSLSSWHAGEDPQRAVAAKVAVDWLRFFDTFSLNLCRGPDAAPFAIETPQGEAIAWTWIDEASVELAPWPFVAGSLEMAVPARRLLPEGDSLELGWRLRPSRRSRRG